MRSSWSFVGLTPEARKAAEEAAEAAGMDLDTWLSQLIKYRSAIELRGGERTGPGKDAGTTDDRESDRTPDRESVRAADRAAHQRNDAPASSGGPDRDRQTPSGPPAGPRTLSGAYVRPATVARADRSDRSLEARAAELRRREPGNHAPAADDGPNPPRPTRDEARPEPTDGSRAAPPRPASPPETPRAVPAIEPAPATTAKARPTVSTGESGGPTPYPVPDLPAPARETDRPPPMRHPAHPSVHVSVQDGVPRLVATDMLRPSLLGAINLVGDRDVDAAYERWLRSGRLEPLTVRPAPDAPGSYEIVAGIDRWHAARRAKAPEVPIIERALNDEEAIREGLASRIKRGHLSALEEADVYLRLMTDAAQTTEQVARLAGKPPAHIATMVRVLNLPKAVREMIERGDLTVLHARALLDTNDPETIAREIVDRRLDIYQTEQLVRMAARDPGTGREAAPAPARPFSAASAEAVGPEDGADVTQTPTEILERHLTHLLGLKVTISEHGDDGVVSLHYGSRDQLSDLIARLNSSSEG